MAKHGESRHKPGQRSVAWQKMRVNQGQDFVIGGSTFDALVLGSLQRHRADFMLRGSAWLHAESSRGVAKEIQVVLQKKEPAVLGIS